VCVCVLLFQGTSSRTLFPRRCFVRFVGQSSRRCSTVSVFQTLSKPEAQAVKPTPPVVSLKPSPLVHEPISQSGSCLLTWSLSTNSNSSLNASVCLHSSKYPFSLPKFHDSSAGSARLSHSFTPDSLSLLSRRNLSPPDSHILLLLAPKVALEAARKRSSLVYYFIICTHCLLLLSIPLLVTHRHLRLSIAPTRLSVNPPVPPTLLRGQSSLD
jgi:hypothetical protein